MTTVSSTTSPQGHHETRPRATSALSFSSNRSRRSSGSHNRLELVETSKDKKRLNTKADPSKALSEAQPAAVALEESNLEDLRQIRHKDADGNLITDPDKSNPTRHRLERPLDTIRSFNAAAEGTSSRRSSSYHGRAPSQFGWNYDQSRRNTYYGQGFSPQRQRPAPSSGGYYRNSSYGFGPQSSVEESPGSSQQFARPMRNPGYPYYGHGESPVSSQSQQYSYETMTSGSDENSKSTNPSSQNSSFDQLQQIRKPDDHGYDNQYSHYGNETSYSSPPKTYSPYGTQNGYYNQATSGPSAPAPPPKPHMPNNTRQPIKLGGSGSAPLPAPPVELKKSQSTKRQSWIKRRFSRRESDNDRY